jgi:sulfite reductase (NADPH) hemoprotein beta-component
MMSSFKLGDIQHQSSNGFLPSAMVSSQRIPQMAALMQRLTIEMRPVVLHVAAGPTMGPSISIFGDHSDIMSARETGFAMLSSNNAQECHDMAVIAHLASLRASSPFVHFFDGLRVSHEVCKITTFSKQTLVDLVPPEVAAFRKQLHKENATTLSSIAEANARTQRLIPEIVSDIMSNMSDQFGTTYQIFEYAGSQQADTVFVAMGSGTSVVEEFVGSARDAKVGVVKVRLFRPWSAQAFLDSFPSTVKRVIVCNRTRDQTAINEPLFMDVAASFNSAFYPSSKEVPRIQSAEFGLGVEDFTPESVLKMYRHLSAPGADKTPAILQPPAANDLKQFVVWGFGGDGTLTSCKDILNIVGMNSDLNVQGYFTFGTLEGEVVTSCHLRAGVGAIHQQYLVTAEGSADYVAVHSTALFNEYDVLKPLKVGGNLLVNCSFGSGSPSLNDIQHFFPAEAIRVMVEKKVNLFLVDSHKVILAGGQGSSKRMDLVMQTLFFKLSGLGTTLFPFNKAVQLMRDLAKQRGENLNTAVLQSNLSTIDAAAQHALVKVAMSDFSKVERREEQGLHLQIAPSALPQLVMPVNVETPYIRLLNVLLGDRLAILNAAGNLYEDNAEYGYGSHLALEQQRSRLAEKLHHLLLYNEKMKSAEEPRSVISPALETSITEWVEVRDNFKAVDNSGALEALLKEEKELLGGKGSTESELIAAVWAERDLLRRKSHWIIGGDGWAYDIGYGGLDTVLSSNQNVNVLIIDTSPGDGELSPAKKLVSSFTRDKSSPPSLSATAKSGMGLYAMQSGNAYVASIALHASYSQAVHALEEAAAYPGPSVVVAYLPSNRDVETASTQAVLNGTWPLYRWRPTIYDTSHAVDPSDDVPESDNKSSDSGSKKRPKFLFDSETVNSELYTYMSNNASLETDAEQQSTDALVVLKNPVLPGVHSSTQKTLSLHKKNLEQAAERDQLKLQSTYAKLMEKLGINVSVGGDEPLKPKLAIIFGSDGGRAEKVAKEFEAEGKAKGITVAFCKAANHAFEGHEDPIAGLQHLIEADEKQKWVLLFVVSTAGQGEFPENSKEFAKALVNAEEKHFFTNLRFAVFSMGDRNYWARAEEKHFFCKAGFDADKKLVELGAQQLVECGVGDDQDEDGYNTGLDKFSVIFWSAVLQLANGGGGDMSLAAPKPKKEVKDNNQIKIESNYLRGTIAEGLLDTSTGGISAEDGQLTKFHGIYQQDDRDIRNDRKKAGLEPAYSFMIRVRVPGGVATPAQHLRISELADLYGNGDMKLTTRQAYQLHGILKSNLKKTIQEINYTLMDTLAACGDVNRNVMCTVNPHNSRVHKQAVGLAVAISAHLSPQTSAYHEIWLDKKKVSASADEEPLYGKLYLPRKFKVTIAVPPHNDVDVFAHCAGFIAIVENDELVGYNVTAGGGMGMTHNMKETFPRLADVLGFCTPEQAVDVVEKIMLVQRDFGDRKNRKHARLKYTLDDRGADWYREEVESRLGYKLGEARPYTFTTSAETFGWSKDSDGKWHYTMFVENGRVIDKDVQHSEGSELKPRKYKTGLDALMREHKGEVRLTNNQNIMLSNIEDADKAAIEHILKEYNLDNSEFSQPRKTAMACVALPTCTLALAEAERYLPNLMKKIEKIMAECGVGHESINIRMTGCPNGCARPYLGEIGFVGRAPGVYNMYMGADHAGQRLSKLYKEAINEEQILECLRPIFEAYGKEREDDERFGDFTIRKGYIKPQLAAPANKYSAEKRAPAITFHEHTSIW